MANFNVQKHWWIVVVALAVVGIAGMEITDQWLPDYSIVGAFLLLGLIGAGFCWAYSIDRERLWWAIIPGLAAFTLLAAVLSDMVVGPEPKNDWINVLVMGVGTAIIGVVLKRPSAKFVLYVVAAFMFLIGILMMTWLPLVLRAVLVVVGIVLAFFLLGRGMRK